MEQRIQRLPDDLINKIAAGEVVERPVSVVRELVDNALDAGATDISVALEEGGVALIRVTDNGAGMNRDNARLAFERHATSKIRTPDDLESIATFGFRGEALSAIASVAHVRMTTRDAGSATGIALQIEGGRIIEERAVAAPVGTEIEIRGLFHSVPARRKFLKQPRTEAQRVKQWMQQAALPHAGVRYRLSVDGQEVLHFAQRPSASERARDFVQGSTVQLDRTVGSVHVTGIVGHPSLAKADAALVLFVNKRLISDRALVRAVKDGFDSTLKSFEVPVGVVFVELPLDAVDVNVHPQKSEVRFRDTQLVFVAVRTAVLEAVRGFAPPVEQGEGGQQRALDIPRMPAGDTLPLARSLPSYQPGLSFVAETAEPTPSFRSVEAPIEIRAFRFAELRYVGQILSCYLVCELNERLYVVDMHAAHERYNFNLVRNGFERRNLPRQQLLLPVAVELTELQLETCLQHEDLFERFGFEVEAYGPRALRIRAVPAVVNPRAIEPLVREIASAELAATAEGRFKEVLDHIAARIACHASVRSGDLLERAEVEALFQALDTAEFSTACPHGRPVIVSFSAAEIERWFGRDR